MRVCVTICQTTLKNFLLRRISSLPLSEGFRCKSTPISELVKRIDFTKKLKVISGYDFPYFHYQTTLLQTHSKISSVGSVLIRLL